MSPIGSHMGETDTSSHVGGTDTSSMGYIQPQATQKGRIQGSVHPDLTQPPASDLQPNRKSNVFIYLGQPPRTVGRQRRVL